MAGGVTPRQIYDALIRAGASTTQAIGIMANSLNESTLDPEAVNLKDPNGGSYGFVQENGSKYASLVTGHPAADLREQVRVLALNGGFAAANGATPAEAAGNFAAKYEICQGCQPGGQQYQSRVSNAATVAGWVSSGKWPKSAGSASAQAGAAAGTSGSDPTCAGSWPSLPLGIGGGCMVQKKTLRHAAGIGLMAAGGIVALPGVLILVAFGLKSTGAGRAAVQAAGALPTPAGRATRVAVGRAGTGGAAGGGRARRQRVRRENEAEDRELRERGASDIRTARRPVRREIAEGRRPAPGPGRRTSSRRAEEADQPPF